eukprot:TRINITY_DN3680_c0_g1_i1.p1 TRINITY_DN3680_c0_g1~~TRINITY_DN3680_c0_g1_i1.p1  ORF type:complete len:879 (+),score=293.82 TRINITY_DN3680_c0_g1_i1:76-2712(+)
MLNPKMKTKLRIGVVHEPSVGDLAAWVGQTLAKGCSRETFVLADEDVVVRAMLPAGHVATCARLAQEFDAREATDRSARSGSSGGSPPRSSSDSAAADDVPPPYCCAYKPCSPKAGKAAAPPSGEASSPKIVPCSPPVAPADVRGLPTKTLFVICFADGMADEGKTAFKQINRWAEDQLDVVAQAVNGKSGEHNFWTHRMSIEIIEGNLVATVSRKLLGQRRLKRVRLERLEREGKEAAAALAGGTIELNAGGAPVLPQMPAGFQLAHAPPAPEHTPPTRPTAAQHQDPQPGSVSSASSTPMSTPGTHDIVREKSLPPPPVWTELPPEPVHYDELSEEDYEELKVTTERRLRENQREYTLKIGVDAQGGTPGVPGDVYNKSLDVLRKLAVDLQCGIRVIAEKTVSKNRICGECLLRMDSEDTFIDMRVAICGNVDSGKSTLVGVLTRGMWDDGRGAVRAKVFVHKHEKETGRTSAVSEQYLGFDSNGQTVNYAELGLDPKGHHHKLTAKELSGRSAKVVTLYDLAGHERYLKTTVQGITGSIPDYACIVISANNGIQRMTKEHLGLCLALKIPFFVVITRVDSTPPPVIKATLDSVVKMLKMPSVKKLPYLVKKKEDVTICAKNIKNDRIAPIFMVSNVTGEHIDHVVEMLDLSPIRKDWESLAHRPKELIIDSTFFVSGVGTVVGGIVSKGTFKINDTVYLGPSGNGTFRQVQIKSIQVKGLDVQSVAAGHDAAFALKKEKRNAIRKGNVMVEYDPKNVPCAYREFCADIIVLYHSTTIKSQYEPVIHCSTVRQSARITLVDTELLRTGDKARVRFKFLYRAEYLTLGSKLVFREGRTKGLGTITGLLHPGTGEWVGVAGSPAEAAQPAAAAPAATK